MMNKESGYLNSFITNVIESPATPVTTVVIQHEQCLSCEISHCAAVIQRQFLIDQLKPSLVISLADYYTTSHY